MLKERIKDYFWRRPTLVGIIKCVAFNQHLMNNRIYKVFVLGRMRRNARRYPHGKMGLSIETTVNCNANCVMCFHSKLNMQGTMSMELFKKIIDDCHANNIKNVGLSIYGEVFMDPYLFERIEYLRKYDMNFSFFTNGSLLDEETARKLFALGGLKKINFSLNAFSPEIYEEVMVGLNRDTTYNNVLNFLRLKEEYKQKDLNVAVSIIRLFSNQKDIRGFIKFWKRQKGVDRILVGDLCWKLEGDDRSRLGHITQRYQKGIWQAPCKMLWENAYVYFDGKVSPCCCEADTRQLIVGDMNRQTLREVFVDSRLEDLRKQHLEDKRKLQPVCGKCPHNYI